MPSETQATSPIDKVLMGWFSPEEADLCSQSYKAHHRPQVCEEGTECRKEAYFHVTRSAQYSTAPALWISELSLSYSPAQVLRPPTSHPSLFQALLTQLLGKIY